MDVARHPLSECNGQQRNIAVPERRRSALRD